MNLNSLIAPSTLHLREAMSINDKGEIMGIGVLPDGSQHEYVLIPNSGSDAGSSRRSADTLAHAGRLSPAAPYRAPTPDVRRRTISLICMDGAINRPAARIDRQELILEAALRLLARRGISGVSMRAVAREAEVALGLVNYYFDDKTSLIAAALRRVEEQDITIVEPDPSLPPEARVLAALRRVADPEFLTTEYLSLRLQLWALAQADEVFENINTRAQLRYRDGLSALIRAARPDLSKRECDRRAADIDILQNGMWLTALLGLDRTSIRRTVARSEEIALSGG